MSYEPSKLFIEPVVEAPTEAWRKALMDAADVIRKRGWCQKFHDGERVCAVGALHVAFGSTPTLRVLPNGTSIPVFEPSWPDGCDVAADHVKAVLHLGEWESLPDWNDAPERTADEVISALEAAARS